jgi:hypothetical protein
VALFDVLVFLFNQVKLATYILYCIFRHKAIAWATCDRGLREGVIEERVGLDSERKTDKKTKDCIIYVAFVDERFIIYENNVRFLWEHCVFFIMPLVFVNIFALK